MAKRSFSVFTWTPTATADTTVLATSTFMALGAANATQLLKVIEIYEGGLAGASNINTMQFARDSTLGAGLTALVASAGSDGPMSTFSAALAAVPLSFVAGSTLPQRSSVTTAARLQLAFNSFGGIVRWVAAPGEEWDIYGVAVNLSETSLSNVTSTAGAMASHIIYEPW